MNKPKKIRAAPDTYTSSGRFTVTSADGFCGQHPGRKQRGFPHENPGVHCRDGAGQEMRIKMYI
jgi:hypothetical protein